ncbi:helix-turn-helix domain-containing protein [Paenibacillus sp. LHD-117]|uniref:winged helix-turn-helix transcriptional regulator n=1 Tax=Paenibacillus sp. LHD-117 TaxID=3071412 RepID=UPI0027E07486|nr:helix-turn-helix domain-containing protein [Paenibacillus sp. LHD-117]MDQ6420622.1 helix-turn-helix domain-containing protein [Paenibacillus sp. LHD-117]
MAEEQHKQQEQQEQPDFSHICSVLQILGAKWSFLVIAELSKGPRRFKQLHRDVAVVKTQSLTDSLRHLERSGIVHREVYPSVPISVEYSLTEKGIDFLDSLKEMERWAAKWGAI